MKNLKKSALVIFISALLIFVLAGCGKPAAEKTSESNPTIRVAALKGPTGMGMVGLMEADERGETASDYTFLIMDSPDDLVGKIVSGDVDVAAIPTNLALVLYNKTQGALQLAAVNTLGVLSVLENGDSIETVADLKGKTIYTSGKGATPDYILHFLLKENGLEEGDVTINYSLQHAELATSMAAGDVAVGLLPQPHVTTAMMKNNNLRIALDITQEWSKVSNNNKLGMGAIVVRKDFVEKNKNSFDGFLQEYEKSVRFVNEQVDDAAKLITKYQILPGEAIAKKAIPKSNIVFIEAREAKPFLQEFYEILFEANPKSVGGKLADDEFYYRK